MVSARKPGGYVELPRGLRVRVRHSGHTGEVLALDAVVRRIGADQVALGVLDLPDHVGQFLGKPVTLAAQLHGRTYVLDATVSAVERTPPAIVVSMPTEARHSEQRRFYRLNSSIDARASWQEAALDDASLSVVHRLHGARLLDISGGGALVRARGWAPLGAVLQLEFSLEGDGSPLSVGARTLRVQEEERTHAYRINTEFEGISRRTQEQIVRFIFRQQALLSRRRTQ